MQWQIPSRFALSEKRRNTQTTSDIQIASHAISRLRIFLMKDKSFKLDLQTLIVIDVGPLATPSDVSVQNCRDPQRGLGGERQRCWQLQKVPFKPKERSSNFEIPNRIPFSSKSRDSHTNGPKAYRIHINLQSCIFHYFNLYMTKQRFPVAKFPIK